MSSRKYLWNAFETSLDGALGSTATSVDLLSVTGLRSPGYLVIAKENDAKREYIAYTGISGLQLTGLTRGLPGSAAGAQSHDTGSQVHSVPLHQIFDDLFNDIETLESGKADSGHVGSTTGHPVVTVDDDGLMAATDKVTLDTTLPADIASNTSGRENSLSHVRRGGSVNGTPPLSLDWDTLDWSNVLDTNLDTIPTDWTTYALEVAFFGTIRKDSGAAVSSSIDIRLHIEVNGSELNLTEYNNMLNGFGPNERIPFHFVAHSPEITRSLQPLVEVGYDARMVDTSDYVITDYGYTYRIWRLS